MAIQNYRTNLSTTWSAVDEASRPVFIKGAFSLSLGSGSVTRVLKRSFDYSGATSLAGLTGAQVKTAIEADGAWAAVETYSAAGEYVDRDDVGAWYALVSTAYTNPATDSIRG